MLLGSRRWLQYPYKMPSRRISAKNTTSTKTSTRSCWWPWLIQSTDLFGVVVRFREIRTTTLFFEVHKLIGLASRWIIANPIMAKTVGISFFRFLLFLQNISVSALPVFSRSSSLSLSNWDNDEHGNADGSIACSGWHESRINTFSRIGASW